jgi:hypothetical protein
MYLLDANTFIQSHRTHYGLDFVPAFWEWLDVAFGQGLAISIEAIRDELVRGGDELTDWVMERKDAFLALDAAVQPSLTALAAWAGSETQLFSQGAVATFLSSADYQLVAYAHAHRHTVVTFEVSAPLVKKAVKIPDACSALGVPCMNAYTMLRRERATFVLAP